MSNPYSQYQKTQVTTASREKILLMLNEGAIRFTKHAHAALKQGKIGDKGKYISKATAILSELMATLDFKAGGQLAVDLENLYVFMIDKLIEGNIKNDPECLEQVEKLLLTLYEAWKDVVENPRDDGVPSARLQPKEYAEFQQAKVQASAQPQQQAPNAQGQQQAPQNKIKLMA